MFCVYVWIKNKLKKISYIVVFMFGLSITSRSSIVEGLENPV